MIDAPLTHILMPTNAGQKIIVRGKPGKPSALHVVMSAAAHVDSLDYEAIAENASFKSCRQSLRCYLIPTL